MNVAAIDSTDVPECPPLLALTRPATPRPTSTCPSSSPSTARRRRSPALVARLLAALEARGSVYEIILVDDGSPDRSWERAGGPPGRSTPTASSAVQLMRELRPAQRPDVRLPPRPRRLRRDHGRRPAAPARGDPQAAGRRSQAGDLDLVYGSYGDKQHGGWRNLGSALVNAFYRLVFGTRRHRHVLPRHPPRAGREHPRLRPELHLRRRPAGLEHAADRRRCDGRAPPARGGPVRLLAGQARWLLALNLFTNFSLLPLQVVSLRAACWRPACGWSARSYYLVQYFLSNIDVPGYASIIVAVLVLGGMQLLSLGVMGEYLGPAAPERQPQAAVRRAPRRRSRATRARSRRVGQGTAQAHRGRPGASASHSTHPTRDVSCPQHRVAPRSSASRLWSPCCSSSARCSCTCLRPPTPTITTPATATSCAAALEHDLVILFPRNGVGLRGGSPHPLRRVVRGAAARRPGRRRGRRRPAGAVPARRGPVAGGGPGRGGGHGGVLPRRDRVGPLFSDVWMLLPAAAALHLRRRQVEGRAGSAFVRAVLEGALWGPRASSSRSPSCRACWSG